ncbi:M23 family metallopeptidase [Maribacter sp.]|uniref:murein hydrolase activator EnvC family protein n=1 Tax=Maribacter sp. TaxID=1897614 RepID=UPI00329A1737
MQYIFFNFIIGLGLFGCKSEVQKKPNIIVENVDTIKNDTLKLANGFDFPVGKPNASGYYNAQKFGENNHLGEDWNGVGGGNTDLGDSIYAIANGYVSFAEDINGGWGNVIRIIHQTDADTQIESLYAHCLEIDVQEGDYVNKGDKIGTIGNNGGQYLAHLHLELRSKVGLPIGGGYSSNTSGYINPTEFIKNNRK